MKLRTKILLATPGVLALLFVLGGSGWRYLGGAHSLDIAGIANKHGGNLELPGTGWTQYGNDHGGHRYSSAKQITTANVEQLERAWEFSTGDMAAKPEAMRRSISEATPILVDDLLVFCTPFNDVIALDPGTGQQRWRFNANINLEQQPANKFVCRGVAQWHDSDGAGACASRILTGTNDARLIALDARTGKRCGDFGDGGQIVIYPGMELIWPGEFQITSPPAVIGDIVIVGSAISDNVRRIAPRGIVRAFDVRTGEPRWEFDPIPRVVGDPNWHGDKAPVEGHANAWAPLSVDEKRRLVFVPTSSPSPDFYGGQRHGDNRHANSIVALDAASGKVSWAYQLVHHDVWDYDLPAQPGLYTVWRDGAAHDVVAQVTKTGHVFVLDRDTGEPFLPIAEVQILPSSVDGERLSLTQPLPVATPNLIPDRVDPDDAFGLTWYDKRDCEKQLAALHADGLYTPPTLQGSLLYPFTGGGANWGGPAYVPERNLLIVNMSSLAHVVQLIPQNDVATAQATFHGQELYGTRGSPFGYRRAIIMSPFGLPCTPPPWGIIASVDLASGKVIWRRTLGTVKDLAGIGIELGTPTFGGPVATSGDLIFIAAVMDNYLRAFDIESGGLVWEVRLPAGGQATPMTYFLEETGKQYVVIAAGGHGRMGTTIGDYLIAFALPD